MQSEIESISAVSSKFLCLEDRLLQALYKEEGPVLLQKLADPIAITSNAALSIAHRIKMNYPQYLIIEAEDTVEACNLVPIKEQVRQVQQFLNEGGFTKINEQEFIQYYEKELKWEKRQTQLRHLKEAISRKKWAVGVGFVVGMGIVLAAYLHKQN